MITDWVPVLITLIIVCGLLAVATMIYRDARLASRENHAEKVANRTVELEKARLARPQCPVCRYDPSLDAVPLETAEITPLYLGPNVITSELLPWPSRALREEVQE